MEALEIVKYPDPVLRRKTAPLEEIDDLVRERAAEMIRLMYRDKGVGLAAPQVGWSVRLFVMNPTGRPEDERVLVNPVVHPLGRAKARSTEGCLSIPEVNGKIERWQKVELRAYTLEGARVEETLEGFPARVCQHECDHLDGVLIIDRMSEAEKSVAEPRLKDLRAAFDRHAKAAREA
jgi:peptide deformylase